MSKETRKILPIQVSNRNHGENLKMHIEQNLRKSAQVNTDKLYIALTDDENTRIVLKMVSTEG